MVSSISVEQVRTAVAGALGVSISDVVRLQGSVANEDFVIRVAGGGKMVLKAGPAAEIAAESWACRRLAAAGAPVPDVLALELDPTMLGRPFVILTFEEGEPSDDADVAREAGRWLRRVHAEQLVGWGPVVVDADGEGVLSGRGRYHSFRDAIEAVVSGLTPLVDAGVLDAPVAAAARDLVSVEELLDYPGPGVLLHNDLKPAHLFGVDDGHRRRLSAIIDWGDVSVGDPIAELARLSMSGEPVTTAFFEGYGQEIDEHLARRLARYRLLWNIGALSYEYRAGGDWFDVYRDRIRADTQELGRQVGHSR